MRFLPWLRARGLHWESSGLVGGVSSLGLTKRMHNGVAGHRVRPENPSLTTFGVGTRCDGRATGEGEWLVQAWVVRFWCGYERLARFGELGWVETLVLGCGQFIWFRYGDFENSGYDDFKNSGF
ncbi:hypothetical protein PanWU01x14_266650 [Parasponia andersonii]|uniref:Uncharacterized protein n=1 Tax=Parasponia andersonii TaxID=3476 RepID=A0A2P5B6S1_PARAD|nr:hypothetical protein PanWU01x14_266650 [Parasponia andersonii]